MKNITQLQKNIIGILLVFACMLACSDSKGENAGSGSSGSPTETTLEEGEALTTALITNSVTAGDITTFNFDIADYCSVSTYRDTVRLRFKNSIHEEQQLDIKIEGYDGEAGWFSCAQTASNATSTSDPFQNCGVILTIPSNDHSETYNTYATYRNDDSLSAFSYRGSCRVTLDTVTAPITGSLSCDGLVQTHLYSLAKNPVVSEDTADLVVGAFQCGE